MIAREFVTMAAGNLWRMKLRSGLTVAGVVIGIGALVAMLSFAFGIQKNVAREFRSLGLLYTLHVLPSGPVEEAARPGPHRTTAIDTTPPEVPLDDDRLAQIAALPGVALVYPQDTFDAQVMWSTRTTSVTAQVLPAAYVEKRSIGELIAGRFFASDSVPEAVISRELADELGASAETLIGDTLVLKVAGRAELAREVVAHATDRRMIPRSLAPFLQQLTDGILPHLGDNSRTLRVCGVAELKSGFGFRLHDILLPPGVASGIDRLSFRNPLELLARINAGPGEGYRLAVVTLDPYANRRAIADSIEALGLRTFSFSDRLGEMRRAFLIFDLIVGVIGFIALVVASLGIVNTMVMSILERTREIGILKSLGAEAGQIRWLFLIESGLIGLIGSCGGLGLGWMVSRIASLVAKRIMTAQEVPVVELFAIPPAVALGAVAFGAALSLAAGLYPAARAARVDPVQALRHD
jgi:putative ABC transport system permease protein